MEILFSTSKLQKVCNSAKETDREWGQDNGKKVRQRLAELAAASCLADMMKLPQARCHALKGDRAGQFAVDLKHPKRLVFEPAHDPVPKKADGGLDLTAISSVRILGVVDYHD